MFVKGGVALVVTLLVHRGDDGDRLELDVGCHAHVVLAVLDGAVEGGRESFRRVTVADAADAELLGVGARDPHRGVEARVLLGVGVDFRVGDGDVRRCAARRWQGRRGSGGAGGEYASWVSLGVLRAGFYG